MQPFKKLSGVAAPLNMINVDTDMIIPKQFLKTIKRTGLGSALFHEMRTRSDGSGNPDFVLNKPAYKKAQILIAGANFGCGSAMEIAATVILAAGIKAVVARSFSRTFFRNAVNNGLLPIECDTSGIGEGDRLSIRADDGRVEIENVDRRLVVKGSPLPPMMLTILDAGGLVELVRRGQLASR